MVFTNEVYSITFRCNKSEFKSTVENTTECIALNGRQWNRRKNVASVVSYG